MRALLLLLCAVLAVGQTAPYRIGGDVTAPVVVSKTEPRYTDEARIAKLEGTVGIAMVVNEEGVPYDMRVTRSLGLGLDEYAIAAVTLWRFKPGTKEGKPVPVIANIEVNFHLWVDPSEWHLKLAAFAPAQNVSRAVLMKAPYPHTSGRADPASVSVSFDVNESGVPANVQVEKSSDPKWESEVIALVRDWRFEPGLQDGRPAPVHATLNFARGDGSPAPGGAVANAYRIGGGVSAPTVIYKVEPEYTNEARAAGLQGTVVLFVVITPDGRATNIKVMRPLGKGLDQAAIESVEQWKFKPGLKDGTPVPVQATIEVNFRL